MTRNGAGFARDWPEWLVCPEAGTLWGIAWSYWDSQVIEAGSDRGLLLRRLKALYEEDPRFQTLARKYLLEHLELTVAPLKAKPGTPEALIDALTEYNGAGESFVPDGPYLSLVELGFDAVPALIEHLHDPRFTRRETGMFDNFRPYRVRVGHLVSGVLDGLADGELEVWGLRGDMADPEVALRWWASSQVGEEASLLGHVIPKRDLVEAEGPAIPNELIVRALGAKHPAKLAEVYSTVLQKTPVIDSRTIVQAILKSSLSRERKMATLEQGGFPRKRSPPNPRVGGTGEGGRPGIPQTPAPHTGDAAKTRQRDQVL